MFRFSVENGKNLNIVNNSVDAKIISFVQIEIFSRSETSRIVTIDIPGRFIY